MSLEKSNEKCNDIEISENQELPKVIPNQCDIEKYYKEVQQQIDLLSNKFNVYDKLIVENTISPNILKEKSEFSKEYIIMDYYRLRHEK